MPHITPLLLPSSGASAGGAETQIFLLASELARRGYRVALICFDDEGLADTINGVFIVRRPPPDRGRKRLIGKLVEIITIWKVLGRAKAPVVVQRAAGFITGAVALTARMRGMRFVYSSANIVDFTYERLDPSRRNRMAFHTGVRLSWRIIVQSSEQAELCRGRFHREAVIIKSIAQPAGPTPRADPEAFLWVARLTSYKRPYEYLELARSVPEARFWMIATGGEQHAGLDAGELARAASEVPNLELLASRPRDQLMELIPRAVAMVNTADYEGMPNIFLEGWTRGVPALALSHDPDGVIERERLGFFAGGSREAFVRGAAQLWAVRADRSTLSARCRGYVEREHAVGVVAEQWSSVLRLQHLGEARP
jgi:glycosyltransferase involved in cell wall biosynthesis